MPSFQVIPRPGGLCVECPEAALAQVPTSGEGPQEDLQVISRGSQNRQVECPGRHGLQVWSPEPGVQGDEDKEQKGHLRLQPKQCFLFSCTSRTPERNLS